MKKIPLLLAIVLFIACSRVAAQSISIISDNTWESTTTLQSGTAWTTQYGTWGTFSAVTTFDSTTCGSLPPPTTGGASWGSSSPMWSVAGTDNGYSPVYFRKRFVLTGIDISSASNLNFSADNGGTLYINGHQIPGIASFNNPMILTPAQYVPYLVCDTNEIAIAAADSSCLCRDCWWTDINVSFTAAPTTITDIVQNASCGACNGSITINLPPYTGPATYAWIPVAISGNPATGLCPGVYGVTVTDQGCADTLSVVVGQDSCCTPPTAQFSIDGSFANNDTICAGSPVVLNGYGGTWGKYYIDNGADTSRVMPVPMGGRVDTLPVPDATVGTHTLCFVAFTADPDSTSNWCSDTACLTFTIINCCSGVSSYITSTDTFLCINTAMRIHVGGGPYGRFISEFDGMPLGDGGIVSVPDSGIMAPIVPDTNTTPGVYQFCWVSYSADPDSTLVFCSDTACITVDIQYCPCLAPAGSLSFVNSSGATVDTLCLNGYYFIHASGGVWGQLLVDGVPPDPNGDSILMVEVPPTGLPIGPVDTPPGIGNHMVCMVFHGTYPNGELPDCTDTVCINMTLQNCCTKPTATLSIDGSYSNTDTLCFGTNVIFNANGAPWGKLYADSLDPTEQFKPIPPGGLVDTQSLTGSHVIGSHTVCFIAYTDTINGCADTTCVNVLVQECGCSVISTPRLVINNVGNMQYQLYDSYTGIAPNFINWIIDGSTVAQTVGTDTFVYQFGPGHHDVCMQTATFLPGGPNGDNICCYNTVCDSIYIDACMYWRATDTITFQLDSVNVDSVTFTFHGSTSPLSPTLVWNFGDGTTLVSSDLTVGHLFTTPGSATAVGDIYNVCVDVIRSRGDSITYDSLGVCCCVDTICLTVETNPCALPSLYIAIVDSASGSYIFQVLHSTSYTTVNSTSWIVNGVPQGTGPFLNFSPAMTGSYSVCADFDYTVLYDGNNISCEDNICQNFSLTAPAGAPGGFIVYPNPTTGQTVVQITNNTDTKTARVEVEDMTGKHVMSKIYTGLGKGITQNYLDISTLPQGIYTIRMTLGDVIQVDKLVKE